MQFLLSRPSRAFFCIRKRPLPQLEILSTANTLPSTAYSPLVTAPTTERMSAFTTDEVLDMLDEPMLEGSDDDLELDVGSGDER